MIISATVSSVLLSEETLQQRLYMARVNLPLEGI